MTKKSRKMRGTSTHGYGARKKHRGKGSKGGKGMAGTGKRGDQKKSFVLNKYGSSYFGKKGFVSLKKKGKAINLDILIKKMPLFIEKGIAKKTANGIEIDLKKAGYNKLLGRGKVNEKLIIKVNSFSKKAQEKIKEVKGQIIGKRIEETKQEEKKESQQTTNRGQEARDIEKEQKKEE